MFSRYSKLTATITVITSYSIHYTKLYDGFDEWGFNWNAQQFNGYLINMLLGDTSFEGWPHFKQHVYQGEGMEFWDMLVTSYDYWIYMMPVELLDTKLNAHWNTGLISKDGVYPVTWVNSDGWIRNNFV